MSTTSRVYRLLVNRVDRYLTAPRGKWYLSRWPLTMPALEAGINGTTPLALCAVSGIGTSRWTGIDVDRDDLRPNLLKLAQSLATRDCVLFEYSRRGGHVFIFHQPVPWADANAFGRQLADQFGLPDVEVYPKFNGPNALRLPGSVHPKTGRRYPIVGSLSGVELTLAEALALIEPITLPTGNGSETPNGSTSNYRASFGSSPAFDALVEALNTLTAVRVYAPGRGIARCPWHSDRKPSLYVKHAKFHCLSATCGVWGDVVDVERFIRQGIRPPH